MLNLAATLTLEGGGFMSTLRSMSGGVGGALGALGSLGQVITGLESALNLAAMAGERLIAALDPAGRVQQSTGTFETLLGSLGAAKTRMGELRAMAATTNYGTADLVKASTMLQNLTGNALSAGKGLRLVGDAAAVVPDMAQLDEVALHIGRIYSATQNGTAGGESLARLSDELGLIDAKTKAAVVAALEMGKKGPEVWALVEKSLMRFGGQMDKQSKNWLGRMSAFEDGVTELYVAFGTPIIETLGPLLDAATGMLGQLVPLATSVGDAIGGSLRLLTESFADGTITSVLFTALEAAFVSGVNVFARLMIGAGAALHSVLTQVPRMLMTAVQVIGNPSLWTAIGGMAAGAANMMIGGFDLLGDSSFWGGIGSVIIGSFKSVVGKLMEMFLSVPAAFVAAMVTGMSGVMNRLPKMVKDQIGWKDDDRSFGEVFKDVQGATMRGSGTASLLQGGASDIASGMQQIQDSRSVSERFQAGLQNVMSSGAQVLSVTKPLGEAMTKTAVNAGKVFVSQFAEAGDVIQNTAAARLGDMMAGMAGSAAAKAGMMFTDPKKGADAPGPKPLKAAKLEAPDNLARIGGFVGGQGPGFDYARATAGNTERLVKQNDTLITQNKQFLEEQKKKSSGTWT